MKKPTATSPASASAALNNPNAAMNSVMAIVAPARMGALAERAARPFEPAKGPEKGSSHRQKLFSTFFQNPLAHSLKM